MCASRPETSVHSPNMESTGGSQWDWTDNYDRWASWQTTMEHADSVEKQRLQSQRKRDKMSDLKHISCCSDHSEELRIYEMTPAAQLAECETFKKEGMLFYNQGQYYRVRLSVSRE